MKLKGKELKSLIIETRDYFNLRTTFVEKDFYAISLLKDIAKNYPNIIFKGGTCLSKCLNIINRFSEDIDVSTVENHLTQGQCKKLVHTDIENAINENNLILTNKDNIRSRREFNRFICKYDSIVDASEDFSNVILELTRLSPCFPYENGRCQTYIGKYLDAMGKHDLCVKYELEEFCVKVQSLERTFVDKVFAICDYQISKKLFRNSRHIYDLFKIIPRIRLDDSLYNLFQEVRKYRVNNPNCFSAQGDSKLKVIMKAIIDEQTYKNDFNNITKPLLYDDTTYIDCHKSLIQILKFLENNNL